MASSGMLCHVTLVITDVSEELNASIIRVTRIGELGKLAVTSNRRTLRRNTKAKVLSSPIFVTLMMEVLSFSETSVLTRATRRNIPEDAILHGVCLFVCLFCLLACNSSKKYRYSENELFTRKFLFLEFH
jgi:hypothetical protein